jgi:hypothetical protein
MRQRAAITVGAVILAVAGLLAASVALDAPSREYHDSVVIEAPRKQIWNALIDFAHYGEWNPYITAASGRVAAGGTITLRLREGDGELETREAEILILRPPRKLEWRSRMVAPGILDRERIFRVIPLAPGRYQVRHDLRVEGLASPFADVSEDRAGGAAMLAALRDRILLASP